MLLYKAGPQFAKSIVKLRSSFFKERMFTVMIILVL